MKPELKKLADMALEDGVLTENEKQILIRKASSLGEDVDELEMYLENKLGSLAKKEQDHKQVYDSQDSLNRIYEIENQQAIRKQKEAEKIQEENKELNSLTSVKIPSAFELKAWWNDLDKKDKKALGELVDANKSFFGTYKPDEVELEMMYEKYYEADLKNEYEKKRSEIEKKRKERNAREIEQKEIDSAEIKALRSKLTKVELDKLDKKTGLFGKIKSFFK